MNIKLKSRIFVFIFSLLVWIALTGLGSIQEFLTGVIIASLITIIAGHFLITSEKTRGIPHRLYYAIAYLLRFIYEMIKANLNVAYLVIHPLRPIKPGIVKIKTNLTKDSAITTLCNSITLTPGTLTVDVSKDKKEIYIHWINVKTVTQPDTTKEISSRFEHLLKEVFE